ncbi:MAG: 50S ribosomal protein L29 [bacterium]|nr:50S ribosomal protein L29 [bacterium]MDE0289909.1 50S ribosomal protein L29 [bacterium]MDE0439030.1 50S ribosomal protein L29 [bacterium]
MRASEMRDLTPAELVDLLDESKEELFNLRFQLAVSQSNDTASLGRLRRRIARIKTVMHEAALEDRRGNG